MQSDEQASRHTLHIQTDWRTGKQTDFTHTYRLTNRQAIEFIHAYRQTNRQADRPYTYGQSDEQARKQPASETKSIERRMKTRQQALKVL